MYDYITPRHLSKSLSSRKFLKSLASRMFFTVAGPRKFLTFAGRRKFSANDTNRLLASSPDWKTWGDEFTFDELQQTFADSE